MDSPTTLIDTVKSFITKAQSAPKARGKTVRIEIPLTRDTLNQTVKISGFTKMIYAYRVIGWRCFPGCFRPRPLTQTHAYDTSSTSTLISVHLQDVKYSPFELLDIVTDMLNSELEEGGEYNGYSLYSSEFNITTGHAQIRGQSNDYEPFKLHPTGTRSNPIMGGLGFRVLAGAGLGIVSFARSLDTRDVSRQPHPHTYQIFCARLQSLTGGDPLVISGSDTSIQHQTPIVTVRRDERDITEMSLMNETITHVNPIAAGESLNFQIVTNVPFPHRNTFAENGNGSNNAQPQLTPTFSVPDIYIRFEFFIDQ